MKILVFVGLLLLSYFLGLSLSTTLIVLAIAAFVWFLLANNQGTSRSDDTSWHDHSSPIATAVLASEAHNNTHSSNDSHCSAPGDSYSSSDSSSCDSSSSDSGGSDSSSSSD